jgi:hypothetical protein
MSIWLEIAAQVKNATGEEIDLDEQRIDRMFKVLRALEVLSQRVANLESRLPEDMGGRTI